VCICSLRYPACNVHAPYCHLWPAQLYYIWPHQRHDVRKIVIEHTMWVFISSTPFFSETFLIPRKIERDMIKNIFLVFMSTTRYPCQIFTKLEFSRQIFEKCSNIKFSENPFSGSRVVPCVETEGQTNRQTRRS
jgi:hypothetical protein